MRLIFIFAGVAIVGAALVYFLTPKELESAQEGELSVSTDPADDEAMVLKWSGDIDETMAPKLLAAFDQNKDRYSRFVIDLHSPGGSFRNGEQVINAIRSMKRSHSVWTYVGPESDCLSMCVPVYMEGKLRVAAPTSQWMFHEPQAYDAVTGARAFTYEFENRQMSLEGYNRFFKNSGIDEEWMERLRAQWRGQEIWKSGQDLKDENSNIVTVIE